MDLIVISFYCDVFLLKFRIFYFIFLLSFKCNSSVCLWIVAVMTVYYSLANIKANVIFSNDRQQNVQNSIRRYPVPTKFIRLPQNAIKSRLKIIKLPQRLR